MHTIYSTWGTQTPDGAQLLDNDGKTITLQGMIYHIRKMSGFAFILIQTCDSLIQCLWTPQEDAFPLEDLWAMAWGEFTGRVRKEPRSALGVEVILSSCRILSRPGQKSGINISGKRVNLSLDQLLDARPVTLRNQREQAVFRIQGALEIGIRTFLEKQGFQGVHTPKLTASGAEGGAEMFDLDYFGQKAYLAQSPQLYKQMLVGAFQRVYEIGPIFRAERHHSNRHLAEYTGVDIEMAFVENITQLMTLELAMLQAAFEYCNDTCQASLKLLEVSFPEIQQVPAITFKKAKEMLWEKGIGQPEVMDLNPEEEKELGQLMERQTGSPMVFVTHYPSEKRPFYAMDDPVDASHTLSFDLLFRGMEITTGGQRIHDYTKQVEKIRKRGMDPEAFGYYLQAHRQGLPPHGGFGLGLERLTARLLKLSNVRYAAYFPRDDHRLVP